MNLGNEENAPHQNVKEVRKRKSTTSIDSVLKEENKLSEKNNSQMKEVDVSNSKPGSSSIKTSKAKLPKTTLKKIDVLNSKSGLLSAKGRWMTTIHSPTELIDEILSGEKIPKVEISKVESIRKPKPTTSNKERKARFLPTIAVKSESQPGKKKKIVQSKKDLNKSDDNKVEVINVEDSDEDFSVVQVKSESPIKLQCHKCYKKGGTPFEAYTHQSTEHNDEFKTNIKNFNNFDLRKMVVDDNTDYYGPNEEDIGVYIDSKGMYEFKNKQSFYKFINLFEDNEKDIGLYIDTADSKEFEQWQKLGIYQFQDRKSFEKYLKKNNLKSNFQVDFEKMIQ